MIATVIVVLLLLYVVYNVVFVIKNGEDSVADMTRVYSTRADLVSIARSVDRPLVVEYPPPAASLNYTSLLQLVKDWNPDQPDEPANFKESLQTFNYLNETERAFAERYRDAEIPFKIYNVPEIDEVSAKWTNQYLLMNVPTLKGQPHVERSNNNHFMFWANNVGKRFKNYQPPTTLVNDVDFRTWQEHAINADRTKNSSTYLYFMTGVPGKGVKNNFIGRDLGVFSTAKNNFFITNVPANKGIQCRFGMRGVIAEAHYDSGRNMVAMLKGKKRYILTPPWSCDKLAIIADKKHPSYRHSVIDWSSLEQAKSYHFDQVQAIDTIVRTGEILYIPSYWFHYIVSLTYSIQCNSRSGSPPRKEGLSDIQKCLKMKI